MQSTDFTQPPVMQVLGPLGVAIVMATRVHVMARRRQADAAAALRQRFRSDATAAQMRHMIDVVASVWPERFAVFPPCCAALSPDERLLGQLVDAAADNNRPEFDAHARDLLDCDARDLLWRECVAAPRMFVTRLS